MSFAVAVVFALKAKLEQMVSVYSASASVIYCTRFRVP